jgi:hypothetical protein
MLAEVLGPSMTRLHPDLESSISRAAAGQQPATQLRRYDGVNVWVRFETPAAAKQGASIMKVQSPDQIEGTNSESLHESQAAVPSGLGSSGDIQQASTPSYGAGAAQEPEHEKHRRRLFS